jgi:hypothetical protein
VCPDQGELERCGMLGQGAKNAYKISFGNPQYKGHLEEFDIDGRIKLKLILVNTTSEVLEET